MGYYLNAFISAARTVRWVMNCEYDLIGGFADWAKNTSATEEEQDLLDRFKALRNRTQKRGPLRPTIHSLVIPYLAPIAWPGGGPDNKGSGQWYVPSVSAGFQIRRLVGLDGREIWQSCHNYWEYLQRLVDECEAKFGIPRQEKP